MNFKRKVKANISGIAITSDDIVDAARYTTQQGGRPNKALIDDGVSVYIKHNTGELETMTLYRYWTYPNKAHIQLSKEEYEKELIKKEFKEKINL